jgi:hypothetical protein
VHLIPSDPDIATLYRKISTERLDLQPNFQRGEVWGKPKKQRLIDSIIRGWHIPPIHIIQLPDSEKQEVLDGQQRLCAIRDFMEGKFPINGAQEPKDDLISGIDGCYWDDLPQSVRSKIEDFTIRVITISGYRVEEPGELFFRLNQPTSLTAAEQRNAYFGEARQQVKELVEFMERLGFAGETIGFSNSRMAYDDVLAKCLMTFELKTFDEKITASNVTSRYRSDRGFSDEDIYDLKAGLSFISGAFSSKYDTKFKLNKATLYSWVVFARRFMRSIGEGEDDFCHYFHLFESLRSDDFYPLSENFADPYMEVMYPLIQIYQDRASARVSDISSVKIRDLILWGTFCITYKGSLPEDLVGVQKAFSELRGHFDVSELAITAILEDLNWGRSL